MNTYYTAIQTLKQIFEQDINVSTVVTGNDTEVDDYDRNMFPLVHLNVTESPFLSQNTTAVTRYNIDITVVDIRDINNEDVLDKFWLNDNRHDNLDLTRAILKKAENKLIKDTLDNDVTLNTAGSALPFMYKKDNLLDGWEQTFTIDVPDTLTTVCDVLEIIAYNPDSTVTAGDDLDTLEFWFNDVITLETGSLNLKYNGDFFGDFTESDMTVSGNKLTVTINKLGIPFGDYYSLISEGLVSSDTGDFAGVTDVTELTFSAIV